MNRIEIFLTEFSLIITNLEIGKSFKREINRIYKLLHKYYESLTINNKKQFKTRITAMKKRLKDIIPYDEQFKYEIAELRDFKDIVKTIESINLEL
jgi:hypothetical protein